MGCGLIDGRGSSAMAALRRNRFKERIVPYTSSFSGT